jgi:hypothetical protein
LNKWIEKEKKINIIPAHCYNYFIRKSIKKTIMTNPYSAAYITAFDYFKEAVLETTNTKINFGSEEEISFKRFYKFISQEVEDNYFLANNSKKIIMYVKQLFEKGTEDIKLNEHDSSTNLVYYILDNKTYDFIIVIPNKQKKRITKKHKTLNLSKIDHEKILISIRAN